MTFSGGGADDLARASHSSTRRPTYPRWSAIVCGGSAVPESLMRTFDKRFGVPIIQAWGMTETSPLASICRLPPGRAEGDDGLRGARAPGPRRAARRIPDRRAGRRRAAGARVRRSRAPTTTTRRGAEKFTDDGWLRTGDVAEIKDGAFIKLVDRTKDLIKSGGEWISSVELENEIMAHPDVLEAAVDRDAARALGRASVRMRGSPRRTATSTATACASSSGDRVAKWWLPDRVEFIDEVPKTSVGKFDKKVLRSQLAEGTLGTSYHGPPECS